MNRQSKFLATPLGNLLSHYSFKNLVEKGFFEAPASTKYHGSYEGGLFDHSYSVMQILAGLTESNNLRWEREESPYIVGMFHDLCKIDQYCKEPVIVRGDEPVPDMNLIPWKYNQNTAIKGHGDKSVMLLSQYITLTEEEIMCIRYHMGAFTDKEEWKDYTNAVHKYPNVLWTHHADMIASHVNGV